MYISLGTVFFILVIYLVVEAFDSSDRSRPSRRETEEVSTAWIGKLLLAGVLSAYCYFSVTSTLSFLTPPVDGERMGEIELIFKALSAASFFSFGWVLVLIAAPLALCNFIAGLGGLLGWMFKPILPRNSNLPKGHVTSDKFDVAVSSIFCGGLFGFIAIMGIAAVFNNYDMAFGNFMPTWLVLSILAASTLAGSMVGFRVFHKTGVKAVVARKSTHDFKPVLDITDKDLEPLRQALIRTQPNGREAK